MNKIIYSGLSFRVVKCLYDSYNKLGYGNQEKYYQGALEQLFNKSGINFIKDRIYAVENYSSSEV